MSEGRPAKRSGHCARGRISVQAAPIEALATLPTGAALSWVEGKSKLFFMITFAGREYRPSPDELKRLATALEERGQARAEIVRRPVDGTFGPLVERIRWAAGPPENVIELEFHEAAAVLLATADVGSSELDRFAADYIAGNGWTQRPLSAVLGGPRAIGSLLATQIGQWFSEGGLEPPIGGFDENGDDLPPGAADFAALAGANAAFADVATAWARANSSLAEPSVRTDDALAWIRRERKLAEALRHDSTVDEEERARAAGRAWALREAGLWIESAAHRSRLPWEPPRHQA